MAQSIQYRGLRPGDYDDIIRVWTDSGLNHRPRGRDSREHLSKEMLASPDLIIGAFCDDKLIGTVLGSYDGRRGCVNRLAIVPEFRRQQVARELVARCEAALQKRGALVTYCLIEKTNTPSLTLFQSLGYSPLDHIVYLTKREAPDL